MLQAAAQAQHGTAWL